MDDLLTLAREHDLPPLWDGLAVVWEGWRDVPPVFLCGNVEQAECPGCGGVTTTSTNIGLVGQRPDVTHDQIQAEEANRRLLGWAAHKRKRIAWRRLTVDRCANCKHDVVVDMETDEVWDLDYTDYGPDGSVQPA